MRGIIFANGHIKALPQAFPRPGDLIIAANGGTKHCHRFDILPDILIGDLDSIDEHLLSRLKARGTDIQVHPPEKDFTDLELAMRLAVKKRVSEIVVFGALGGRWDMSLANIFLLSARFLADTPVKIWDAEVMLKCITATSAPYSIEGIPGDLVSLIPLTEKVRGVTLVGLGYALSDATLVRGETRSVSNFLVGHKGSIEIKDGLLLVIQPFKSLN